MLLTEPQPTPYDLRFSLLGFPVRISPWFWLVSVLLGGRLFSQGTEQNTGTLLLIWVGVVLVSILVHELGHAFAFRHFGTSCEIVLYQFGGLAIPNAYESVWQTRARDPRQQVLISAAGPAAQIASALIVAALVRASGHAVPSIGGIAGAILPFRGGQPLPSFAANFLVDFYLYVSIYWALLNLVPVYPLDGGQIARSLFMLYGGGDAVRKSLMLSVMASGGMAFYGLATGNLLLVLMFASLGYSSYQMMNQFGGGYGGGTW
ncbi:MAG: site-2 protease family protein [Planctomycetota bacterium]